MGTAVGLGPSVHLLLSRVDDHSLTGLGGAGGCLGALECVVEMGTNLMAPSSMTGDSPLPHF